MDRTGPTAPDVDAEYRPVSADEDEEFRDLLRYAFRPAEGPRDPSEDGGSDLGENRGMYVGDDLRAACRHHFWETTVRDATVDLAGLSAVASPPESRRKGLVAAMLAESLAEYRDRGCEFAALWPFDRSFYDRYGWGSANARAVVSCAPAELSALDEGDGSGYGAGEYDPGEFRRLDADDWALADEVYRDHAARYDLSIDRSEDWWRERTFDGWSTTPFVYGVERAGELVGYLRYEVDDGAGRDDRTLVVHESAWRDDDAFRDLLRFAYYHDSQVGEVEFRGVAGGHLRDLLDVVDADHEVRGGPMVRVVDVERALSAVRYPENVTSEVSLAVRDSVVPANDGRFRLSVADGTGTVERLDGASGGNDVSDGAADVVVGCSVAALSELVVGYRAVGALSRVSNLAVTADADDETALVRLGRVFPPRAVFLRDFF